jgi:hypothetical protein
MPRAATRIVISSTPAIDAIAAATAIHSVQFRHNSASVIDVPSAE